MTGLLNIIRERIGEKGPITLADYMDLALQHPLFGYYRHGDPLGKSGDFITAPEVSQMFGEMVGLWMADVWQQMGKPMPFTLLELGPGRGTLMVDALRATTKIPEFHKAMRLHFLESNFTLREIQRQKLSDFDPHYIDNLSELPEQPLLVVANEFFDALSVRQFANTFQGWCENLVAFREGQLSFTPWPLDKNLLELIPDNLKEAPPETVYEISLSSCALIKDLAKFMTRQGGVALILDYGYTDANGHSTLQAVKNHNYTSVFASPGEHDLTAHVDFTTLGHVARAQGASVFGPVGQGAFLKFLGIDIRAAQLKHKATSQQSEAVDAALHRLTDASHMGVLFKAMALTSPSFKKLLGF